MSIQKSLAIAAAMMLAALQGCQTNQATAPDGDRSAEGSGNVAFRLSQRNVEYLRADAMYLEYRVTGPGMDTVKGWQFLDTSSIFISGIPCGTRVVAVQAVDSLGQATWTGSDTVEINPNLTTTAGIVLHRVAKKGGLLIDITLDSLSGADTAIGYRNMDTTWTTIRDTGFFPYSYDYCDVPVNAGTGSNLQISCYHKIVFAFPGDTTWTDTIIRNPYDDTTDWCWATGTDSSTMKAEYRCYHPHYLPYSYKDTIWQDSVVHTASLNNTTWCHPSVFYNDTNMYCFRGKYEQLAKGTCEKLFYGNGFPQGMIYNCTDSLSIFPPADTSSQARNTSTGSGRNRRK